MDFRAPARAHRNLRSLRRRDAGLPQLPPLRPGRGPSVPRAPSRAG